ncbi:hypothetical protein, partial [Pseudomonas aeruginosa]|uniref:hypothetical protein n=1 Tax=Pseudomonas aeruginosa TaxID=287 RepID=UPI0019D3DF93
IDIGLAVLLLKNDVAIRTVRRRQRRSAPRSLPLAVFRLRRRRHAGGMPANPENARKASRELFAIRLKAPEHKGCGASEGLRFL